MYFQNSSIYSLLGILFFALSGCGHQSSGIFYPKMDSETGLMGYVDESGKWKIAPRFVIASEFSGNVATVEAQNAKGFLLIGRNGEVLRKVNYFIEQPLREGCSLARLVANSLQGYVDKNGNVKIDFKFSDALSFSGGLARVKHRGKYCFIDHAGVVKICPNAEIVLPYSNGLAAFQRKGLWGYIDRSGKEIIPPKYAWVQTMFGPSTAKVRSLNGREVTLDALGRLAK